MNVTYTRTRIQFLTFDINVIKISRLQQDMDADTPLPDAMGEITIAAQDVMDMLTMDGLTPSTAARSCRDLSLDYPDYSDGKQNLLCMETYSHFFTLL